MNNLKKYIKDLAYNVKKVLPLKDDLDKIIEREYEKAFEILDELGIIEYIKSNYGIDNYKKPELEILEDESSFVGDYVPFLNQIIFSKKFIKIFLDSQLKFLNNKKRIEEIINRRLKFLGYKEIKRSIIDVQDIGYLYVLHNLMFLYPSYINEKNKEESIVRFIVSFTTYHESLHSFNHIILGKLAEDSITEYINYSDNISNNNELRATAFQGIMYYLASGLYKDERAYKAVYANIPICRMCIEKINILKNNENTSIYFPYDLGLCYGNIIVAKYRSSLKENIYNIIDDILHLDEKKAIEVIRYYVYNPDKLLHD
jgi:hypothetical protein